MAPAESAAHAAASSVALAGAGAVYDGTLAIIAAARHLLALTPISRLKT